MKVNQNWEDGDFENFMSENWCVSCTYGDDEDWVEDLIFSNFKQEWSAQALKEALKEDLNNKVTLNQIFVKYTNNPSAYVEDVE